MRTVKELPPIEILRRYFRVDEHARLQRWTPTHGWRLCSKTRGGKYFMCGFEGRQIPAHRIIWALHHGRNPEGVIDHINGKPWDNRIENLREATPTQNRWNAKCQWRANKTGYENVEQMTHGFRARVCADYQNYYSPIFDDPELAGLAAQEMQHRLHGEFAYINSREAA